MICPEIIDVTLRDGSNAVDFQFDKSTTQGILRGLDEAGIHFIDMGHGLGLGASEKSGKKARLTDEDYENIARETIRKAHWGFFFQPKFGSFQDIAQSVEKGAHFVRIGTDIDKVKLGKDFIAFAKQRGLQVHSCLMKAYAVDVYTYVERVREVADFGSDLVVFMDSAGTMTPDLTKRTMEEAVTRVNVPQGFHAHNNMDLAIGNLIAAVESGVAFIDTSLRGLGRSAGNGATEIMSLVLRRMGTGDRLDWKKLQDTASKYVDTLKANMGISNLEMIFGYAGFHSGFETLIDRALNEKAGERIDKREVIIRLCEREKINVDENLVKEILAIFFPEEEAGSGS
jgi:4-hydroxy 2-oxovalerate aldolase